MVLPDKSQLGFAHPFLVFIVAVVFVATGFVGWRVHALNQHTAAQAARNNADTRLRAPRSGSPILYGIPLGNISDKKAELSTRIANIDKQTLPTGLDAGDTIHHFFQTLRDNDPYGALYMISSDFWTDVVKQAGTSDPHAIVAACSSVGPCHSLIATRTLSTPFTQTTYRSKSGLAGITMDFKLSDANIAAAKYYQKNAHIQFSLIPYTAHGNAYWAIDRMQVGDLTVN